MWDNCVFFLSLDVISILFQQAYTFNGLTYIRVLQRPVKMISDVSNQNLIETKPLLLKPQPNKSVFTMTTKHNYINT